MTPQLLPLRYGQNEKLAGYFRRHPLTWIPGRRLERVTAGYSWRTRISNLRLGAWGGPAMDIRNHQVRSRAGWDPVESYYCYVPAGQTEPARPGAQDGRAA